MMLGIDCFMLGPDLWTVKSQEAKSMPKFSANLGFLWADMPLPDAIAAARRAGFHAVECHWPFGYAAETISEALKKADLSMRAINTAVGKADRGEFGLAALPGRQDEARSAITQAIEYASIIGARAVHVMAGKTSAQDARDVFLSNLAMACQQAANHGIEVLIEPLNRVDVPGYFLASLEQARGIIQDLNDPNLKLMFDCYHVGRTEGDVIANLRNHLPLIGHIQVAAVPDRGAPDHGAVDYDAVFSEIDSLKWCRPVGAEYVPAGKTDSTLGWLQNWV